MFDFVSLSRLLQLVRINSCSAFQPQKYLEEYLNGLLENVFCRNDHSMVPSLSKNTGTNDGLHHDDMFLSTFSWSSSLLVRSPLSLILDQKACKKTFYFKHQLFRVWHISLTFVLQGGAHFQEIRGPQDPGLELYWSSSLLLPLVTALAGGERLLPDVHEQRLWTHKLCAALWQGVQSESGPCLHRHQIWSVLWELH